MAAYKADSGPSNGLVLINNHYVFDEHEKESRKELTGKDNLFYLRDAGFHKPSSSVHEPPVMEYTFDCRFKMCKHCALLTQVRKPCRCNYSMFNLKYSNTGHWDTATLTDDSSGKPAECLTKNTCRNGRGNGWVAAQLAYTDMKRRADFRRHISRRARAFVLGLFLGDDHTQPRQDD